MTSTAAAVRVPVAASPAYVGPVAAGEPVSVPADPGERLAQLDGFFRRNPGYAATSSTLDALRGALNTSQSPLGAAVTPTELGYGQLLHDQMLWQANTTRQPDNPWWMELNSSLVRDPLTAEALVRSGRVAEAPDASVAAWAKYVEASDAVATRLGLPVGEPTVQGAGGIEQPKALSDVSRSAPLRDRLAARLGDMPTARRALWDAHAATLSVRYPEVQPQLREVAATAPREARFASGWANIVGYLPHANPMATGRGALLVQSTLLPTAQLDESVRMQPAVNAFTGALAWLDRHRFASVVAQGVLR